MPKKAGSGLTPSRLPKEQFKSDRLSDEVRLEMYRLYSSGETLHEIGLRYDVVRERIRQYFVVGNNRGLFTYPIPKSEPPALANVLDAYRRERSLERVARQFEMSTANLRAFLDESKVDKASLAQLALEGRKQGAFDDYMTVVEELKQHPTTTVLQRKYRNVKAAIDRQWKTFERFRVEYGIPTPASGNPNVTQDVAAWIALQKTRAAERRRELLERICQILQHDGPTSFVDLRNLITVGEVTLREVLATAEADGVIERARFGKSLEYRLVRTVVFDQREFVVPELRDYQNRVRPFGKDQYLSAVDPLARLKALDRRRLGHAELCERLSQHARAQSMRCEDSDYIDLLIDRKIMIEVKTLRDDSLRQVRFAVSQLLYYRFIHRFEIENPLLVAAFSERPSFVAGDAIQYLAACGIEALWQVGELFTGTDIALRALRI